MVRLADAGTWLGGGTPSKSNPAFWMDGDVPWLSPKDMGEETLSGTRDRITEAAVAGSSVKRVPAGSVAVVARSGILERTLPTAVVPFETTLNQDMKALVPHAHIIPGWVAWFLRAREQWVLENARKAGTTVASLEWKKFLDLEMPVPPTAEQRHIVDLLEEQLSRLGHGRETVSLAQQRLATLTASWLRRSMTPLDSELSTVGEALLEARGGWSRSRSHLVEAPAGVPYLKMNNIARTGGLDLRSVVRVHASSEEREKYGVKPGDVLFNSKNSGDLVGKTALADDRVDGAVLNENIMRLRFADHVQPAFAALWFRAPIMRRAILDAASASTNVAAVYQRELVRMPMWTPEPLAQRQLVQEFGDLDRKGARLSSALRIVEARARATGTALLSAAFSGRLTGAASDLERAEELIDA